MAPGGETDKGSDFFISYTRADRAWAEWIAWVLEEDGHKVLVQAWDFVPGSNWIQRMDRGIEQATRTIAVLSVNYLTSVYGGAEWRAAWAQDPEGTGRKLLVVRVADCDLPGLLAGVVAADLFGLTDATATARLRDVVAAALSGRAKPATRPAYPDAPRAVTHQPDFPGQVGQIWNVPRRNPNFTGRAQELGKLTRDLTAGSRVTVKSVHGMGGVGKSQLVIEYAHAHADDYDLVWWINAEETAAIADQFTTLATQLGLTPAADPDDLQVQVHDRLSTVPRWLLIFDNANSTDSIRTWLPSKPRAAGVTGHVLITTRRGGFAELGQVLDLDVIPPADAVRLLRTRVPKLDQHTGSRIAEELERLPLALEQVAAYLDRSQLPAADYLKLLHDRGGELYLHGRPARRDETIATVWDLSLEHLNGETPGAVQLLAICSYLAPSRSRWTC